MLPNKLNFIPGSYLDSLDEREVGAKLLITLKDGRQVSGEGIVFIDSAGDEEILNIDTAEDEFEDEEILQIDVIDIWC